LRQQFYDDALLAMLEARPRWDPAKGELRKFLFSRGTYAIIDGIRRAGPLRRGQYERGEAPRPVQTPFSMDALNEMGLAPQVPDGTAVQAFDAVDNRLVVASLLDTLEPRPREVVERVFFRGETLREIADEYGLTESRVCQIKVRALKDMKRAAASVAA
jgi:RNA polymerase sigma factor (sigma-70 family)